uniref:Uncharacterized protein n=1 Tax=Rhizophora mucronata TaxID=61149 RepID=A0A2P2PA23_RHIMU
MFNFVIQYDFAFGMFSFLLELVKGKAFMDGTCGKIFTFLLAFCCLYSSF